MSTYDHYAAAKELIDRLTEIGYREAATTLDNDLAGGATATEILMALRFHLKPIISAIPRNSEEAQMARRLLSEIDSALLA